MWVSFLLMTTTCYVTASTQSKGEHHLENRQSPTAVTALAVHTSRVGGNASQRAAMEIRGLMGAQKRSAVDLAKLLNVSRDTAARRINGESDLSLNELETIAGWLGVNACRIIAPTAGTTYSD